MKKAAVLGEQKHFSEVNFWNKVQQFARQAGYQVIEKALWLYYAAKRPETPTWARTVILSALAYFIMPLDGLPDMLPGVGYADDLSVLLAALGVVSFYIDPTVKDQTTQKLSTWFDKRQQV